MKALGRLLLVVVLLLVAAAGWIAWTGNQARADLVAAADDAQAVEQAVASGDLEQAQASVASMQERTGRAEDRTDDVVWRAASVLPWVGDDLHAVSTLTAELDTVATDVLAPVVEAASVLGPLGDLSAVDPASIDPAAVQPAADQVDSAATALASSRDRVEALSADGLLGPVGDGRAQVLDAMARAEAALAPLAAVAEVVAGL